jgi:hypothetical protein
VDTRPDHLPTAITDHYMNVTLAGDIMLVNKTAFFVEFGSVEAIPNQRAGT